MTEIKVGDELAFCGGLDRHWEIHRVTAITKGGRIKCGYWELNPDLTVRKMSYSGPARGEIPTPEIRAAIKRQQLLFRMKCVTWGDYTTDQLERIAAIISEETC